MISKQGAIVWPLEKLDGGGIDFRSRSGDPKSFGDLRLSPAGTVFIGKVATNLQLIEAGWASK